MRLSAMMSALFALAACDPTDLSFQNGVPGATIENLRWTPEPAEGERTVPYWVGHALGPGQAGQPFVVSPDHAGRPGKLEFDLVVEGSRVSLIAVEPVAAVLEQSTTVVIGPDMAVLNPAIGSPEAAD